MDKARDNGTERDRRRTLPRMPKLRTPEVREVVAGARHYLEEAQRFTRERPGVALGIAFGAGMIFGGSIVNRLVRLAVYSALGAGVQALIRQAPEWIERFEQDDTLEAAH